MAAETPGEMKALPVCLALGMLAALTACTRAPSEDTLKTDLQTALDTSFAPGLLEVTAARRANDFPYVLSGNLVHVAYDANLRLKRDHRFGAWDQANIGTLLLLLDAAPSSIAGVKPGGNAAGDILHVRGRTAYVATNGALKPAPEVVSEPARERGFVLVADLENLVSETWHGLAGAAKTSRVALFLDEWSRARRAVQSRAARDDGGFSIATGAKNAVDWRLGRAVERAAAAQGVAFANISTDGAQETLDFLRAGRVSAVVIRNTQANLAASGTPPFETAGPYHLTALAALYPEPVHVIVKADSPLGSPAELFGKHVGVAGTDRAAAAEAEAILRGHGVPIGALAAPLMAVPLAEALDHLDTGAFDALVMTAPLPNADLRRFAAAHPIRLLPFDSDAIAFLTSGAASYVAITVPARTYPGQTRPLAAVAAVTMLVSVDSVPATEAAGLLALMMDRVDYLQGGSVNGAMISRADAQTPMTLQWHSGAKEFFGLTGKD
jgi:TRAP transporter TAXI family solute receptor